MQTAPFNRSEFDCLKPSLGCVRYWVEYSELQAKADTCLRERENLLNSPGARLAGVHKTLLDRTGRPKNASERQTRLRAISLELAELPNLPGVATARRSLLEIEVAALYGQFDSGAFEADWEKAVGDVDIAKRVKAVEGRLGPIQVKVNKLQETLPNVFMGDTIPRRWGDSGIDPLAPREEVLAFGHGIVKRFVDTWRSRCVLFREPITVGGVLIRSLSSSTADIWQAAYDLLGFGDIKKQPCYSPIISNERAVEEHIKSTKKEASVGSV